MAYFCHCLIFTQLPAVSSLLEFDVRQEDDEIESLLQDWRSPDTFASKAASQALMTKLYAQLVKTASVILRNEHAVSLSSGDLVNEAAIRIIKLHDIDWQDKAHFLALSAKVMRQVLIDHCRKKMAARRKHEKVTLVTVCEPFEQCSLDIVLLEEALQELEVIDPDRVKIVEMRYFGGLTLQEISEVMGVSVSTIKRSWRASRVWLLNTIEAKQLHDQS
jgi:RNA polymerase sigma factor (TIGR02999 family)